MGYTDKNLCSTRDPGEAHEMGPPCEAFSWYGTVCQEDDEEQHTVVSTPRKEREHPWRPSSLSKRLKRQNQEDMEAIPIDDDACSTSTKSSSSPPSPKRRVSFSSVEVREYSLVVGDHPYCSDWLPLSLDWGHDDSEIISIDGHQETRQDDEEQPWPGAPRRLSFLERKHRLIEVSGYTDVQLLHAQQEQYKKSQEEWNTQNAATESCNRTSQDNARVPCADISNSDACV